MTRKAMEGHDEGGHRWRGGEARVISGSRGRSTERAPLANRGAIALRSLAAEGVHSPGSRVRPLPPRSCAGWRRVSHPR